MANKVQGFINEVTLELKKVSWSTRHELAASTAAVFILVIILAVFIGLCDIFLSRFVDFLIRRAL